MKVIPATQDLLQRIEELTSTLTGPGQLSADETLTLTFELTDTVQKATLGLELEGNRDQAVQLRNTLVSVLRDTAAELPEEERLLIEPIADFWALTVESQISEAEPQAPIKGAPNAGFEKRLPYASAREEAQTSTIQAVHPEKLQRNFAQGATKNSALKPSTSTGSYARKILPQVNSKLK